jgi:transposase
LIGASRFARFFGLPAIPATRVRHQELRDRLGVLGLEGFWLIVAHEGAKMSQKPVPSQTAEQHVREIRRATRKKYSAEEKVRIVLSGLRGEYSIAELCRREGIAESLYYAWSKEFLEAGKRRLSGDTERQASSGEVKTLRQEMNGLKELVADLSLENRLLKKSMTGHGGDPE